MDNLTPEQRRKNMQAIKASNTKAEVLLAKSLFNKGYRYRKNSKSVFGKPDLTFKKIKLAVFVDGEFWHGKDWEKRKENIKSNREYWIPKIERNINRDNIVNAELLRSGWIVMRFWAKEVEKNTELYSAQIEEKIKELITKKLKAMPTTADYFVTTLKKAHLEWGSHRHTNSRGIRYGEGYLQIPASDAYRCEITNDKEPARSQVYNFSTSDGFITNGKLKASGNQSKEEYAKQFHGSANLKLLGDWFHHIGATVGDKIEIRFTSPTDILLTKI